MHALRKWLRSKRCFHVAYHRVMTAFKRWRYELRHVHPTFIIARNCSLSPDLVACEYGYIGPGCVIGAHVELGPYVMLASRVAIVGGDHRFDLPGVPVIFAGSSASAPDSH